MQRFLLLTSVLVKSVPDVFVPMCMYLHVSLCQCVAWVELSRKHCLHISACTCCICICMQLFTIECVCMHDVSLLLVTCGGVVFLLVCCCSFSWELVRLSVVACFSCCMALYLLLCYLSLQLVFGWHQTVFCSGVHRLCVQPSCSTCTHCSEFAVAAYCQVMDVEITAPIEWVIQ